jgi:hypothetical protein
MSNNDLKLWIFLFALIFLFDGKPDVWDCLRAQAGVSVEGCK